MLLSLSVTAIRTLSVGDPCDGMSEKRCFFYLHWASFIICTSVRLTLMHIPLIRELQESLLPEEGRGGHSLPAAQHLLGFRFLIYTFKQNVKNNINPHWKQLNILCITWKTLVFSSILFFFCLFLVYYNKEGIACKILSVFPLYRTMACTFPERITNANTSHDLAGIFPILKEIQDTSEFCCSHHPFNTWINVDISFLCIDYWSLNSGFALLFTQ